MRKSKLKVEMEGREDFTVLVDGRDIRKWEAVERQSFLDTPLSYTALCDLAGFAAVRQGMWDGSHEAFMELVVNVADVSSEDDPQDPSPSTHGGDS